MTDTQAEKVAAETQASEEQPSQDTTTQSAEPVDPQQQLLTHAKNLFSSVHELVKGEVDVALEDYKALQEMNGLAAAKYADMRRQAVDVRETYGTLRVKHTQLKSCLDDIDLLDSHVTELEKLTKHLDEYSRQLEIKFKSL
eukprot:c2561_g1_i1.p1 GENE.c2561_g1_i1~~c2561_g1_i1.p1  ORF type:complete len:154 (+),score=35.18 c2561_g1_i1:42-464(+)